MSPIEIARATPADADVVAKLVTALLLELEPGTEAELERMKLAELSHALLSDARIVALLARDQQRTVGVITLHECAALYAGGLFGEISEFYVLPEYRSAGVGTQLLAAARQLGQQRGWQRLEVGAPPQSHAPRTLTFYQRSGFVPIGPRLRQLIESVE